MEPVELLTSKAFSREELVTTLLEMGVEREASSDPGWELVLRRGDFAVWVILDNDEPHDPDPEGDALIESKLGAPPQTSIVLYYLSYEPSSQPLAMELAMRFASRWPCVLDNLSGRAHRVFTLEELQVLYQNGLGLYEDEKGLPRRKGIDYTDEEYTTTEEQAENEREVREWIEEMEQGRKTFPETPMEEKKPTSQVAKASESRRNPFPGIDPSQEWNREQRGA
jgi:hypothetical protein